MKEQQEFLQQHVGNMLATDKHIHEAVRRQRDDKSVQQLTEAHQLISQIESTLDRHIQDLEQQLQRLGGDASSPVKDAVTSTLGAVAGVYDKVRSSTASKMLRDDYTALSMAAISNTMLHTTGLALHDNSTAEISLRHLNDLTPLITEISRVVPTVVARELIDEAVNADTSVAQQAVQQTQQTWNSENINQRAQRQVSGGSVF